MKILSYLIGLIVAFPNIGTSSGLYSHHVRNHFKMNPRFYRNRATISRRKSVLSELQFAAILRNIRKNEKSDLEKLKEQVRRFE
jgi:hypothetical protein